MTPAELRAAFGRNPAVARILATPTGLPGAHLVAGALAQTLWNHQAGRAAAAGIADYDIAYFDPDDLSAEAEAAHEARLRAALGLPLDVKNQARVHLWFAARFGHAAAPLRSMEEAVATYPTTATAIGLDLATGALLAPWGTGDLAAGIVRANARRASRAVFSAKAARWQAEWPHLRVLPWEAGINLHELEA